MTASTLDDALEIEIVSKQTAFVGNDEIHAEQGSDIRREVLTYSRHRAAEAGFPIPVTVTITATGDVKHWIVHPDGRTEVDDRPPDPQSDSESTHVNEYAAAARDTTAVVIAPPVADTEPVRSHDEPVRGTTARNRTPVAVSRRRPRLNLDSDGRRKAAKISAGVVAAGVAVAIGATVFGGGNDPAPAAPTGHQFDTFTSSGPGDVTSGPGVIEAYDYAYYVYPRNATAALRYWSPDAGIDADKLQVDIDKTDRKIRHRLDITETRDPVVYNALLTLTTPDGVAHPYHQQFHLKRTPDKRYVIASRTTCESTCTAP